MASRQGFGQLKTEQLGGHSQEQQRHRQAPIDDDDRSVTVCARSVLRLLLHTRMHIGARRDKLCSSIHTLDGREFDWVNEVRHLGVYTRCADKLGTLFLSSLSQSQNNQFKRNFQRL